MVLSRDFSTKLFDIVARTCRRSLYTVSSQWRLQRIQVIIFEKFWEIWFKNFSWDDKSAAVDILLYQLTSKNQYKNRIDEWKLRINIAPKTPNGILFLQKWGSVRHALNTAFLLNFLDEVSVAFAKTQLDYVLGVASNGPLVNGIPGSLVVGLGENFPRTPHHRASFCCGESIKTGFQIISTSRLVHTV